TAAVAQGVEEQPKQGDDVVILVRNVLIYDVQDVEPRIGVADRVVGGALGLASPIVVPLISMRSTVVACSQPVEAPAVPLWFQQDDLYVLLGHAPGERLG